MRDTEEYFGTEKMNIAVDSLMAQAQEAEANAAYLRKAGSDALLGGWIKGGADLVSAFAKGFPSGGAAAPTGAAAFNLGGSAGAIYTSRLCGKIWHSENAISA